MNKTIIKNHWILAGLLLIINIILGLIVLAAVRFFEIGSSGLAGFAGIMGAMVVGQIYAMNFKEIMPKELRRRVTVIYISIQALLGFLFGLILYPNLVLEMKDLGLFLGLLVGVNLFYSLFIYWMLGSGGKNYLKVMQKRAARPDQKT